MFYLRLRLVDRNLILSNYEWDVMVKKLILFSLSGRLLNFLHGSVDDQLAK